MLSGDCAIYRGMPWEMAAAQPVRNAVLAFSLLLVYYPKSISPTSKPHPANAKTKACGAQSPWRHIPIPIDLPVIPSLLVRQRTRRRHCRRLGRFAHTPVTHRGLRAIDTDVDGRDLVGVDADAACVEPFCAGFTGWGKEVVSLGGEGCGV